MKTKTTKITKQEILKFEIDEVWKTRNGSIFLIVSFQNGGWPIIAERLDKKDYPALAFTKYGKEVNNNIDSEYDLVEHLGLKKDFPEYFL